MNQRITLAWRGAMLLALPGIGPTAAFAASAEQLIEVPSSETALHLAVAVPATPQTAEARRWRLVELGASGEMVPADLAPAVAADGAPDARGRRVVASIPGKAGGQGARQFRLESADHTPAETRPAPFRLAEVDDQSLGLWEGERRVLVYNHGVMSRTGVPADRNRSTYVHPLYGLDGEVLTDDFPKDHYHHRGLFWAWPHVKIDGREYDLWMLRGIEQRFERWLARETGRAGATLGVENGWFLGGRKVMQERAWLQVFRASGDEQCVDVELVWIPIGESVTLAGAEGKSYGGITLRFAPCTKPVITTPLGNDSKDLPMTRLPWADFSAQFKGPASESGAAIFIAPDHPDYPPMWLTRHYGVLCIGWPGIEPKTFQPGEVIRCRYRVWIHRGTPQGPAVRSAYQAYLGASKAISK